MELLMRYAVEVPLEHGRTANDEQLVRILLPHERDRVWEGVTLSYVSEISR